MVVAPVEAPSKLGGFVDGAASIAH
jgi:hypothetical protein